MVRRGQVSDQIDCKCSDLVHIVTKDLEIAEGRVDIKSGGCICAGAQQKNSSVLNDTTQRTASCGGVGER